MPRLLLINPSNLHKGLGNMKSTAWPPLNLPYLAALTPSHYDIKVIDENIEPFKYTDADLVGITAYTSSVWRAYQIANKYRQNNIPTVIGGIHASMLPDEASRYCDVVVVGEAESVWPNVIKDFETGKLKKMYRGTWGSLDNLPIPRRDVLKNKYYKWGSIQTSRGCPMNCSFCSVTAFNGKRFRRRPLDAVIEELGQIPQKFIIITDDNLIGYGQKDRDWAYSFFEKIIEKGIKKKFFAQTSILFGNEPELVKIASKAGLKIVFIGMESINPKTLESFNKSINLKRLNQNEYKQMIMTIRNAGIAFLGAFIIGSDDDDISVFQKTFEFIQSSHIDVLQVTKPTPLPGTQFWDDICKEGRLKINNFPEDWDEFRLTKMVFEPKRMSIDEIYGGFTYLRIKYFKLWEIIKRTFSTLITTRSLIATILSYKFNASYKKAFFSSNHYKIYKNKAILDKYIL